MIKMSNKSKQNDLEFLHDQAEEAVKNYLEFLRSKDEKKLPDPDLTREVLYLLDYDHKSALWEYHDNLSHFLTALTVPEVHAALVAAASANCIEETVQIIRRMLYFLHEIQESDAYLAALDYAQLDIVGSEEGQQTELIKTAIKYQCRLVEAKKLAEVKTLDND
jgi:hypothetical protein